MTRFALSILLVAVLGACALHDARPLAPAVPVATEAACVQRGGQWTQLGRAPVHQCLMPTTDGGRPCTDNAQCEGLCLAPEGSLDGARVGGACSADSNRFGCRQQLRQGAAFTLCVD